MNKRISFALIALLLVSSVLTACGGVAPVTFSSLPVFTGATETTNDILKTAMSSATDAMKGEATIASVEAKAYDVPAGTTFDSVAAFYKDALEKGGWTTVMSSSPALGYTRGKQGLNVTYMDGVGLMVMLSNIK
jgi:hypothetical protein